MGMDMKIGANQKETSLKMVSTDPLKKAKSLFSKNKRQTPPIPLLKLLILGLLAMATPFSPAFAHSFKTGEIRIGHPWAKPTPEGAQEAKQSGEVYMAFLNQGEKPDQLKGATTSVAQKVTLVAGNADGSLSDTTAIDLPLNRGVPMRPGATHFRLDGLKGGLTEGDKFTLRLTFADAKPVDVIVMVQATPTENPAAAMPDRDSVPVHGGHDAHSDMHHDMAE